jgi:integrase
MGVTVRKPKGKSDHYVFINFDGRRKSKRIGTRRKAEAVAEEIRAQIATGSFAWKDQIQITPTFREMSEQWLTGYCANNLKESSIDTYCGNLKKHLIPAFGNQRIDEITRADFRAFLITKIQEGCSKDTVKLSFNVANGIIDEAIESGLMDLNPLVGITKKLWGSSGKKSREIEEADIFSGSELDRYLATTAEVEPEFHLLFLTAASTGMRLGECLAMQWGDVNLQECYIHVRRSYRNGRFTRPKNGKTRKVDMTDDLVAAFKNQHVVGLKDVLVFGHNNTPFTHWQITKAHKHVLKEAGLRYRKFHSLRHSYASLLLSKGVNLYYVSKQMGHSSIQITSDVYGHLEQKTSNRHVNALGLNANNCNHASKSTTSKGF